MKVAWQTWVLIVLAAADFAMSQVQGNSEQFPMPPWIGLVLLPTVSLLVVLASNQLKAIGSPPPNVPLTERTAKPS